MSEKQHQISAELDDLEIIEDGLTLKKIRFCEEFIVDLNASGAARRALYSESSAGAIGHELLKKPEINARIKKELAKLSERTHVTVDWVLQQLILNYNRAMQQDPVLDKKGQPTGEYKYEGAVANRSMELIGKHLMMFNDNKLSIDIGKMSKEELRERAKEILERDK